MTITHTEKAGAFTYFISNNQKVAAEKSGEMLISPKNSLSDAEVLAAVNVYLDAEWVRHNQADAQQIRMKYRFDPSGAGAGKPRIWRVTWTRSNRHSSVSPRTRHK
jgi:hypothetical protein